MQSGWFQPSQQVKTTYLKCSVRGHEFNVDGNMDAPVVFLTSVDKDVRELSK